MAIGDDVMNDAMLHAQIRAEHKSARRALKRLQDKLETIEGWRASVAWETVEDVMALLDQGIMDAIRHPQCPPNFRHWREKYSDNVPI
jgi:hypothetical protein